MRLIFTLYLFLVAFAGFAQKVDSTVRIITKKQYLSKVIGISSSKRPLILINDSAYHGQMDSIDMDNIQTLDVIKKGAEAKKIYGKAAAHGAVLIKTKINYTDKNLAKGRDLIVLDGEVFNGKLTDLDPNNIFHVDVLNQQNASEFGSNLNSVVVVTTKKWATRNYQIKLMPYSESYREYINKYKGDDSRIAYMVDGHSVDIDTRYNLQNKSINKVEFILTNNYPIFNITTKQ